jgi:thymidylate synthase
MFHASADNIDDLMHAVLTRLLSGSRSNYRVTSKKGASTEIFGALLQLNNPRARLGRSVTRARVYSAIGELLWYLSGSNALDQIQYYIKDYHLFSDDGITLNGAYGSRIFASQRWRNPASLNSDEWQRVIDTLKAGTGTRNAVIQIYSNSDGHKKTEDKPCTCSLQFAIRRDRMEMHVHMRSNDAILGMPHDIFSFTMLQEIAARELNVEVGTYQHSVASLHLYDDDPIGVKHRSMAQKYLDEGLHDSVPMPPIPNGNPWPAIGELCNAEFQLRSGNLNYTPPAWLNPYWVDLIILLQAYGTIKHAPETQIDSYLDNLTSPVYHLYILDRISRRKQTQSTKDLFAQ